MGRKKTVKCAYCLSDNITHPKSINIKRAIYCFINPWSSSNNSKIKIEHCECICCCKCGASYQKMQFNKKTISEISNSLFPLRSALLDFRTIFDSTNFDIWKKHIREIIQPKKGILRIVFRMCKKTAYLDCKKLQGRFVIVAVGVIY